MLTTINFLRDRRRRLTKQQELDRKIFKITSVVLGVAFGVFVMSLAGRLLFAYNLEQLVTQENRLLAQVRSQEDSEKSYIIFAAKLKVLTELFSQRRDKQEALAYFTTLFGSDVLVSDVAYDAHDSRLTLGLTAKDVFTLETVFDQISSQEVKEKFEQVTASELRRNDQGEYRSNVTVTLKEAGATE